MEYDYNRIWKEVYGDLQHYGPVHRHTRRIYASLLRKIQYESVIEVGCGVGSNFPLITKGKPIPLAGIDISEHAIKTVREKYDGEFSVLDIQKEYLTKRYDLVFCSFVLEHVENDDCVIENLYQMTGKYLLISTMQGDYEKYGSWEKKVGHVRNYTRGQLKGKLEAAGYKIQQTVEWGFPFYSPIVRSLQLLNPNVGAGDYNFAVKCVASFLYVLYFLNVYKKGDVIIVLAAK